MKFTNLAVYRRSELKRLIESITSLIDNIEKIFPASQAQTTLVRQEAAEFSDEKSLKLVEEIAEAVDSRFKKAAREVLAGHQYLNVGVSGQAQTGDTGKGMR